MLDSLDQLNQNHGIGVMGNELTNLVELQRKMLYLLLQIIKITNTEVRVIGTMMDIQTI
jgi:hypothetical protein